VIASVGGVYRHYKTRGLYRVLFLAEDTTDANERNGQACVVYVSLADGEIRVRSVDEFFATLSVDGQEVRRFDVVIER
jgi:hypothetical protein